MDPILYKTNASPPARAVMMVADIIGLKLNMKDLNPVLREQDTPELTKKNPMKTVPLLEEDGFYLADSHAIMIYLVDKYGKPEHEYLYPSDKRRRATVNLRLFFDCGVLFPRLRFPKLKQWFITMSQQDYCKRLNELGAKTHYEGLIMLMEYNRQKKSKL